MVTEKTKSRSALPIYDPEAAKPINVYSQSVKSAVGAGFFVSGANVAGPLDSVTFICFTNRCGSNYFAEVLKATRLFDNKGEAFNWNRIQAECGKRGIENFHDYVHDVLSPRQAASSLIKIGWPQLLFLEREGLLARYFSNPKYLWIRRRDFLSQAISLHIARASGKWKSNQKSGVQAEVAYDFNAISTNVSAIFQGNEYFLRDFVYTGKPFLEICYEDFCKDVNSHVAKVCEFLELPARSVPPAESVNLKVQRNEINEAFRRQFVSDMMATEGGAG